MVPSWHEGVCPTWVALPTVDRVTLLDRLLGRRTSPALVCAPEPPHEVVFYDRDEQLLSQLEAFVIEGVRLGETTVIIASAHHRQDLRTRLAVWELDDAFLGLDARQTLDRFMVDGRPDPGLFELTIGTLVRAKVEGGLRAYGEMVALLWAEENVAGTLELEELWNGLQRSVAFPLLCAYPAADVGSGIAAICDTHTHVVPSAA